MIIDFDKEVHQHSWGKVFYPKKIATSALGPCTGIAIFYQDPKKRKNCGIVGHFTDPEFAERDLREMLDYVRDNFSLECTSIFVAGNTLDFEYKNQEDVKRIREFTQRVLSEYNFPNVDYKDQQRHNELSIVGVDTTSGLYYEKQPIFDDGEEDEWEEENLYY